MELSIIIVNYNERQFMANALAALSKEFFGLEHEIIVVDNNSADGSADLTRRQFPAVRLLEIGQNLFYGKGNNVGLAAATGNWLLLINPDVEWVPGQLRKLLTIAKSTTNTVFVPAVLTPAGKRQLTAHRRFPTPLTVFVDYCLPLQQLFLRAPWHPYLYTANEHKKSLNIAHATGVCLLLPRTAVEITGGFDPKFSMYLEETEWQQRMNSAGIMRRYISEASITHFGSAQKTFAQASRHYLWGLRHYAGKHWSAPAQLCLQPVVWLACLVSDAVLLCVWPFSWLLGRLGRRMRHYTNQYFRLTKTLLSWPSSQPL